MCVREMTKISLEKRNIVENGKLQEACEMLHTARGVYNSRNNISHATKL